MRTYLKIQLEPFKFAKPFEDKIVNKLLAENEEEKW
jgi:hypothetical protein